MLSDPDFVTKWKRNSSSFYIFDKFPNSMINKIIYTKFATPDVDDIHNDEWQNSIFLYESLTNIYLTFIGPWVGWLSLIW